MNKSLFLPALFFLSVLCCGYFVATKSWKGVVYVYIGGKRMPAAMHNLKDFSKLDSKSLSRAAHEQVLAHAEIIKTQDALGLRLGHFLTRSADGNREFACQVDGRDGVYDKIQVTLIGHGVAESGEVPKIIVEAECKSSKDLDWLETVWIPMEQVSFAENDQEIQTYGSGAVNVKIENLPSTWPETWGVTNVRMFRSSNPDESLIVQAASLGSEARRSLSFDWRRGERGLSSAPQAPQKSEQ